MIGALAGLWAILSGQRRREREEAGRRESLRRQRRQQEEIQRLMALDVQRDFSSYPTYYGSAGYGGSGSTAATYQGSTWRTSVDESAASHLKRRRDDDPIYSSPSYDYDSFGGGSDSGSGDSGGGSDFSGGGGDSGGGGSSDSW